MESDGGCVRQFLHEAEAHRVGLRSLTADSRLKAAAQFVFFLLKGSGDPEAIPGPLSQPSRGEEEMVWKSR